MKALVCDLDGVVYIGSTAVDGAGEALTRLAAGGVQIVFVTNNASHTAATLATAVSERTGFPATPAMSITAAMAAASYVKDRFRTAYVVGSSAIVESLEAVGITVAPDHRGVDVVVVGLDRELSYRKLCEATLAINAGAAFIATNSDNSYPSPEGLLPGGGAIVAAIQTATRVTPVVTGKPEPVMLQAVSAMIDADDIWLVGDRPETDIAMGRAAGWTTVLVETGVTPAGADAGLHVPDHRVHSIGDIPGLML